MIIRAVGCFQVSGEGTFPTIEERQVGMLDILPEYAARGVSGRATTKITDTFVRIDTDEGVSGLFGPIFEETAPIIEKKLAPISSARIPSPPSTSGISCTARTATPGKATR